MYFGSTREIIEFNVDVMVDKLLFLQNPEEECPYPPEGIHIEPISLCNLNCIHCVRDKITRPHGRMTLDNFKLIIDKIADYCKVITLGRNGEPTLHKNLVDMVRYAKEQGIFVSLITNASVLTEEISVGLINAKLDRIVFSFDSVDKEIYERIRVGAKFEINLGNILRFLKLNFENGMQVYTGVSWVSTKLAKSSPTDINKYFRRLPIHYIYESRFYDMFGDVKAKDGVKQNLGEDIPLDKWPICANPWSRLGIQWNGVVVGCVVDFDDRYVVGNILKDNIQDLWNGEKMRRFRKAILERDYKKIEQKGFLCSRCSLKFDEGMDITTIKGALKKLLVKQITGGNGIENADHFKEKYYNLLKEIDSLSKHSLTKHIQETV